MRLSALIPALLLAALIPEARAQRWFESYEKGRIAFRNEQYSEAVQLLSDAIEQRPESKANARTYGTRFIDYFPYVYRGAAYAGLGRTALALQDFQREQEAGEVEQGTRDTEAAALLRQHLANVRTPPVTKEQSGPEHPVRQDLAARPASPPASATRSPADSLFERAAESLSRGQILAARQLLENVERLNRSYPGLAERRQVIRSREQEIRRGIAAFLRGEYQGAIDILSPAAAGATDAPHLHAFLGSSYAALYLLSGEEESALLDQAREAFRRTRQINGKYQLDRAVVSPQISRIYDAVPPP